MTTTLNNSYLVKVSTKGGGGVKIAQNSVHVVCSTCPILISEISECKLAIKIRSICHMSTSVIFDRSLFSKNEF